MLRVFMAGLSPENETFPLTVAALASSVGAAAGAAALFGSSFLGASDVLDPPHPAKSSNEAAPQPIKNFFICKPFLQELLVVGC